MTDLKLSDHYNGKSFHNLGDPKNTTRKGRFIDFLKWKCSFSNIKTKWVKDSSLIGENMTKPSTRVDGKNLQVSFINHATILLQTEGVNILTDPVWSKRVSPFTWIGPKRFTEAGIALTDLPPIDIVLISHDHYDHLDLETIKELNRLFNPFFIVGLGVEKILKKAIPEIKCHSLDWWQNLSLSGLNFHFVPAKHWSGRLGSMSNNSTLWGGFVIETNSGNIYFAGDTGYDACLFEDIANRFKQFRLSLLPIGAYKPRWFMKEMHIEPLEAVLIHMEINSAYSMAIHFGTFQLSDEGINDPLHELELAKQKMQIESTRFFALKPGANWQVPPLPN